MELSGDLARLAAEPHRAALLFDVDGVLAPIVPRPEDSRVPSPARAELTRLRERYALVAVISGRTGDDVRRLVDVPGIESVGSHGLELAPEALAWRERLARFAAAVDWPVEDKGVTVSFHYRTAEDQEQARRVLEQVAADARTAGLDARWGRKVLELRPPLAVDKGTAVRHLLSTRGLKRALYVGDDTTDVDAFTAVHELELGVAVGVRSAEMPPVLAQAADLLVDGPDGVLELLRLL